jgi:hypothetical protein
MLIAGLKENIELLKRKTKISLNSCWLVVPIVILLSLQPNLLWRGRLWFQLYQPHAELTLENLDVTAQWFFENYPINSQCLIESDAATRFVLGTHFALVPTERLAVYNPGQVLNTVDSLQAYLETYKDLCGLLVGIPTKINSPPLSKVGQLSWHWISGIVRKDLEYTEEFIETTAFLKSLGWTKRVVPPFYWLYKPPSSGGID